MLLKEEVGGSALNSHGNYIADHGKSWKYHGIVFLNFCGNPVYSFLKFLSKISCYNKIHLLHDPFIWTKTSVYKGNTLYWLNSEEPQPRNNLIDYHCHMTENC